MIEETKGENDDHSRSEVINSELVKRLRGMADELESSGNDPLTGIIFAMSGDLEISLACYNPVDPPRETMRKLTDAARGAALYGTMKAASSEQIANLQKILDED